MKILGIDPGLATIGLGLVESTNGVDATPIDWLTIETPAGLPLPERLTEIHRDLQEFLTDVSPDLVVIEKLFFSTNETTGIDVSQARGVIVMTVAEKGLPILEVTPMQLKSGITGDGKADKRQVQTMLLHILKLQDIPKPDDAADALALAVYGALHSRSVDTLAHSIA